MNDHIRRVPKPPEHDDLNVYVGRFMKVYTIAVGIGALLAIGLIIIVVWALIQLVLHFTG